MLGMLRNSGGAAQGAAVVLAVALVVFAAFVGLDRGEAAVGSERMLWIPAAALVGFLAGTVGSLDIGLGYAAVVAVLGGYAIWGLMVWRPLDHPRRWVLVGAGLGVLGVLAVVAMITLDPPRIDVIVAGEAAAEALGRGENPYATVIVADSNPYAAPGSTFEGYFYPPLTMGAYSVSYWLFGDIRWANVFALAGFLLLLGRPWRRESGLAATVAAGGALAITLLPSLGTILRHGWTEPLALPLLAGAALNWRKRPIAAAIMLGVAVATKQYFLFLTPLLFLWCDEHRWRRVGIVGATMLPFVIADPQAFWDATIAPHLSREVRPDSLNAIVLGFDPPSWLPVVAATLLAVALGRRGGGGPEFALAGAAVLGVAFLLGYQAFVNYWTLIIALCVTAVVAAAADERVESQSAEPDPTLV